MELVETGILESDRQIMELAERFTHWWVIRDNGAEILYVGTPETFAGYVRDRNGGLQ